MFRWAVVAGRLVRDAHNGPCWQGAGGNEGQAGRSNLIACVFEYLHVRWPVAGLVGVSETVRLRTYLATWSR